MTKIQPFSIGEKWAWQKWVWPSKLKLAPSSKKGSLVTVPGEKSAHDLYISLPTNY